MMGDPRFHALLKQIGDLHDNEYGSCKKPESAHRVRVEE